MSRPRKEDSPPFFHGYIDLVPESDIVPVLEAQIAVVRRAVAAVPPQRETHAYAPGKWTIREIIGHLGDGEKVFGFRAFCFARFDATPLPGFDENEYVERSDYGIRSLSELVEDFAAIRTANVRMFRALTPDRWASSGVANGKSITVLALAYAMAGHVRHHLGVLRTRYGIDTV